MRFSAWMICLLLFGLCSCTSKPARKRIPISTEQSNPQAKEQALRLRMELKAIEKLLSNQHHTILHTEEGIPYFIESAGKGKPLSAHQQVVMRGVITDMNGTVLYDYRQKPIVFGIMDYTWPSLMQKVLLGMQTGEQRVAYVPSSYAYGLSGDGQKIGSYCSLIINFRLEELR